MNDLAEWPYDADRDDPLTAMRIPVTKLWPDFNYFVAFHNESLLRPTDDEARMLSSFIDFLRSHFRPGFQAELLAMPFDIDTSRFPLVFHKRADSSWAYRRAHWTIGSLFCPDIEYQFTLEQLLDQIEKRSDWAEWKAAHPEVFGGAR